MALAEQAASSAERAERVLILTPVGRDAVLAEQLLERAGLLARVCADLSELCQALDEGAGALLLTQEALGPEATPRLVEALGEQPPWSDLPLVLLVSGGAAASHAPQLSPLVEARVNLTLFERPVHGAVLVSTIQTALRARRRQYELRDQLLALERAEAQERRALERARHLQALTVQLGRSLDTQALFTHIVDAVAELLEVTVVGLYLLEHPDADFISAATRGLEPGHLGTRLPRHASLAGRAVDQRRPAAVEDVSGSDDVVLPRLLGGVPVGAVAVAPIVAEQEPVGAIEVYSPSAHAWRSDDLDLLMAFAGAVAVAITSARHHQREQQAIQARDDFLAAASHDLKNPLTAIRGSVQMLERRLARDGEVPPERLAASIRTINSAATRMTALVDELLDVARQRMGQTLPLERSPTDLVALARRQAALQQATSENHRLEVEASVPQLIGLWDGRRLERVLENLLSNAIKYSPGGGEVTIRVAQEGETAALAVRDRGIGIPAADLPHVFERFRRAANVLGRIEGTGIGLSAAAQIVRGHGGSIDLESHEGEGTLVTVRLPLSGGVEDG